MSRFAARTRQWDGNTALGVGSEQESSDQDRGLTVVSGEMAGRPRTWSRARAANGPAPSTGRRRAARRADRRRIAPQGPEDRVGELLNGTYRLERLIAEGGMGAVYEVSHTRLEQRFAVKFLDRNFAHDAEAYARFRREAETASNLHHANLVQVFDFNTDLNGNPYLVMELVQAQTLHEILGGRRSIEPQIVLDIVKAVCSALDACHEAGVVHRDLKPSNIMVDLSVEPIQVKVLDFGICKIKQNDEQGEAVTRDNTYLGTLNYMSPEQAMGQNTSVDRRTDIFTLGSILYELLARERAFPGDSMPQVLHAIVYEEPKSLRNVPAAVQAVVKKAMSKEREERYESAGEMASALRQAYRSLEKRAAQRSRNSSLATAWITTIALAVGGSYALWGLSARDATMGSTHTSMRLVAPAPTKPVPKTVRVPVPSYDGELLAGPAAKVAELGSSLYRVDASGISFWSHPEATPTTQALSSAAKVTALSISSGGKELLVGQADGTVSRWSMDLSQRLSAYAGKGVGVVALAGGADYLAVATNDAIDLYNTLTGRKLKSFLVETPPEALLMTRGEDRLLIVLEREKVQVVNVDRRSSLGRIDLGGPGVAAGMESQKVGENPRFWVDFDQGAWRMRRRYSVEHDGLDQVRLTLVSQARVALSE